jgi:hypothetical protein
VHTDGGYLVHLLSCGEEREGDIVISIPGMTGAKLLSPNIKEELTLAGVGDLVRIPVASFDTYAVLLSSSINASSNGIGALDADLG